MVERIVETPPAAVVASAPAPRLRISWGAVFGGVIVAMIVDLLLVLLGMAIGLRTINPNEENPFGGFGAGAGIWWIAAGIVALFAGGWAASRLAGLQPGINGALHGIVVWGLSTFVLLWLLTTAVGAILGGAFGVIKNVIAGAGQAVGAVVPGAAQALGGPASPFQEQIAQAKDVMDRVRAQGGDAAVKEVTDAIKRLGSDEVTDADKQNAADLLVKYGGMDPQQARSRVDQWVNQYQELKQKAQETAQQAKEKAREVGGKAAKTLSTMSWLAFFMLLLEGIAAAAGGALGRRRAEDTW